MILLMKVNFQHSRSGRTNLGFSLIELLTVVAIASILSITAVQILLQSQVRGTQAEAIAKLRQEGDSLLNQLTYTIRNADHVSCQNGGSELVVESRYGTQATYSLEGTQLASNGAALTTGDVEVENLLFTCRDDPSSGVTLVRYQFDMLSPQLSESVEGFRQSFSSSTAIRAIE